MNVPRDFVGYGENPPKFKWPNGARLALNIAINYEEGSERNPLEGDKDPEHLNEYSFPVKPGERELMAESIYEYGSRVGIWRIMDVFDSYQVRATVFACAVALERNPSAAQAFVERGYDLVGHGYRWTAPYGVSEDEERDEIRKTVELVQRMTGQRMVGWFSRPPQTPATRRLLAEEGFLFDSTTFNDDIPYYQDVAGRPFLIVPYAIDINDVRFWKPTMFTAGDFEAYCIDSFDALCRESDRKPRLMSVGIHPRIIGRPGRVMGLDRFLAHVRKHSDVWIAPRTEIARFWAERFAPPNSWNWPR